MADSLEFRVSKLEDRIKIAIGLFVFLTGGGALLGYFVNSLHEKLPSESYVENINIRIEENINKIVNDDILREIFSAESIIGQIQAQAACISMSYEDETRHIYAIHRRPLNPDNGKSDLCVDICQRERPFPIVDDKSVISYIGSVHIYEDYRPFSQNEERIFRHGMVTLKYDSKETWETFGPNYCCCARD